jgi:tetratricopeptide (TPR) repeat protein
MSLGEIALAEGKSDEAIRQFHTATVGVDGAPVPCLSCVWFALARAFDKAGEADSTAAYLEKYLAIKPGERGIGPNSSDALALAAVEKRLGELYDAKHDKANALKHYGAFVDQWKNADADLQPVVTTVKKRIAELVAGEGK